MFLEWLNRLSPLASSFAAYKREQFVGDLIAGFIVTIMLVPQSMAYALLAGLPPQVGLYASIIPVILYAFFGTSNFLSVGPVAMVSLLVISGLRDLQVPGSPSMVELGLTLALMVGVFQLAMAAFRLGFLVNFISHPVLVGFTSASAIVIGFSQIKHLLGVSIDSGEYPYQLIANTMLGIPKTNLTTMGIGVASFLVLIAFSYGIPPLLRLLDVTPRVAAAVSKIGPLAAVSLTASFVYQVGLDGTVSTVGTIPAGLPSLTTPNLSLTTIRSVAPLAALIAFVGYLEGISVAKALATRKREKVDSNREFLALGLANVGAAFSGGYPVAGGFSRTMVNFSAGACTPVSTIATAILVSVSVLFFTPLFFYIPNASLAAIIIMAVVPLVDFGTPVKLWHYSRPDATALLLTFIGVLVTGIDIGILIGVVAAVVMLMWKMSRPHVAEVGRVGDSSHFRNILRHDVKLTEGILAFRIDESLTFANAPFLESYVREQVADRPTIKSVLLIASGVNSVDATGLEVLETIRRELQTIGVGFYMSDVKGPVTDRFKLACFDQAFLDEHIFLSADDAISRLKDGRQTEEDSDSSKS
jgi:sulfate permease, SulP family